MLGIRLKELRTERKLSMEDVAIEIEVAYTTYWGWESGRKKPNMKHIKKVAAFFNVSADYLMGKTDTR